MLQTNQDPKIDRLKELLEQALESGRHLQSPQTGLIHHHYHSQESDVQHSIPILENVLFSLALMRSRTVENITEAKKILSRLLAFQNNYESEEKGNFPTYLHEYPTCRDRFAGILLLAPFYWILKHFGHVIGQDVKKNLEQAARDIFFFSRQLQQEIPYSLAVRYAAACQAYGTLWNELDLYEKGKNDLEILQKQAHVVKWHMTNYLSDLLVALQMVYPSIKESAWNELWTFLGQTWHQQACSYVGPCVKEEQKKEEPKPSLYELYMGFFAHQSGARTKTLAPYHLQAVLIQPSNDTLEQTSLPIEVKGKFEQHAWILLHHKEWACTLLDKKEILNPSLEYAYTPFRLVWGNASRTHSFVNQGDSVRVEYRLNLPVIELFFELGEQIDAENRDKQREINFYLDLHPSAQFLVDKSPSNTFEIGQHLMVRSEKREFSLDFELIEGTGEFFGHIMRGNRPSQTDKKGENRFSAYDWHLFLRTVRRHSKCIIKVTIHLLD